ncbi:hypothetical protein HYPSUDRAFT_56563 [Hypholoma sublateritium FD-334 SS-4]|uniref:FAS1 domain-containing protein n=1 Tax=Hypholoma sublateritium (strain FD-334 SS-4) TaxID=945553 RepID=A0A0D2M8F3_HYPSF|nr:hypothetical protein HYPSUDRAFT_56563 [Hypholoma sublateritium FD-334 SS-4]
MRPSTTLSLSCILPLLLGPVQAQEPGQRWGSSNSSGYISKYATALRSAGLNGFADTLTKINGTAPATALFSQLASGRNFTVFAPDDAAIRRIPAAVSQNRTLLAEYISYHFVDGDFTNRSDTTSSGGRGPGASQTETATAAQATAALLGRRVVLRDEDWCGGGGGGSNNSSGPAPNPPPFAGIWPNVTLGRTLLNASALVALGAHKSQVLAWTRVSPDGNITILNQAADTTVGNATRWRNLSINPINNTLIPPGNLTTALTAIKASALQGVLGGVQIPSARGVNTPAVLALQRARGITVFVPANDAFTDAVNGSLQGLQGNASALTALVQNHYINGTTLYSTQLADNTTAVSAAGEPLHFVTNATGTFVAGANSTTARVVHPDVLLDNGVAHIIDQVLFAAESDPAQAASAYESATSAAAAYSTTETGPIGVGPGGARPTPLTSTEPGGGGGGGGGGMTTVTVQPSYR